MSKHLLGDKRFWPFFWTQFFGAFNDNVYKNALVILITFKSYTLLGLNPEQMVALCGGLFILPFFLFSATAGQICDKYPKHKLMFYIKVWEILVMLLGAYGYLSENIVVLIGTLFLMGTQSSFFGPAKFSILPELLEDDELVTGNALVEMGTFVSILIGTILGGVLMSIEGQGSTYVAIGVIIFAIIGTLFSKKIPALEASSKDLKVEYGIIKPTWDIVKIARKNKGIFLAILGISWFWFLGAALLSMFPAYVKNVLHSNEHVVTLFLACFSIGVAIGSITCERLSHERLELGLVPFGTIGMTVFLIDLFCVGQPVITQTEILDIYGYFALDNSIRILVDLLGFSIFAGFFIVPLYTFIQQRAGEGECSRIIAANNIINSLFMVTSAVLLAVFYQVGLTIPEIFLIWGTLNLIVACYIYTVLPEFLLRFVSVFLSRIMYRVKIKGHSNIPKEGGCILTSNHVSFVDWIIIHGAVKRPVRFVMYYKFFNIPFIKFLFKSAGAIPIAGKSEKPEILAQAMKEIEQALKNGDVLCIFPEGNITKSGELDGFRPGIEKILETAPVPVVPMVLTGLWGSFFSRKYNGRGLSRPGVIFKRWFSVVGLDIFPSWGSEDVTAKKLEEYTKERLEDLK